MKNISNSNNQFISIPFRKSVMQTKSIRYYISSMDIDDVNCKWKLSIGIVVDDKHLLNGYGQLEIDGSG